MISAKFPSSVSDIPFSVGNSDKLSFGQFGQFGWERFGLKVLSGSEGFGLEVLSGSEPPS